MSSDVVLMMVSALAQWVVLIQISWHLKKVWHYLRKTQMFSFKLL